MGEHFILFFSFGKLLNIKSNSSCIYVIYINYVLRFHLPACKITNMEEGGRGGGGTAEERGT